jgi:hypothetical protein
MNIKIPKLSLVVLIGPSGSGKSTFARKHFLSTEVLSSDYCRGFVSDDENDQAATNDAFEVLHFIAGKRLAWGHLTVIDATNVQPEGGRMNDTEDSSYIPQPSSFGLSAQQFHDDILDAEPAVKCRGKEYLRIIYSPDYDSEENLPRLRSRSLGRKRSLALREFALGIEALERFVRREPLRRVHECVFGVLALESEPVDPRL